LAETSEQGVWEPCLRELRDRMPVSYRSVEHFDLHSSVTRCDQSIAAALLKRPLFGEKLRPLVLGFCPGSRGHLSHRPNGRVVMGAEVVSLDREVS
jgi:hypothetical protein